MRFARYTMAATVLACACGGSAGVSRDSGPTEDLPVGDAAVSSPNRDDGVDGDIAIAQDGSTDASLPVDASAPSITYATLAANAWKTVSGSFFDSKTNRWHVCLPTATGCGETNQDWGAGSMTGLVWLHYKLTGDKTVVPIMEGLVTTAPTYAQPLGNWSDVPLWDSIAASHEWEVAAGNATSQAAALKNAKAAFDVVDATTQFVGGMCPTIDFQQPSTSSKLKTLETDANYIKAALLLYQETNDASYLTKAETKYAAVRKYFLDPVLALYTVYVVDDTKTPCAQIAHRFFGSVNGIMIDNGLTLATLTKTSSYHDEAVATGQAVQSSLGDASGVYADLQASNDTAEPLIEAMYHLAQGGETFAKTWLLTSADAAGADSATQGTYGRFFNGPAPTGPSDVWQTSGGLALEMVAGVLEPASGPRDPSFWSKATYVTHDLMVTTASAQLTFTGSAIALIGTIGENCCESGHARVFIDGKETLDETGVWQNKDSAGKAQSGQALFAWRWPTSGTHTIEIQPGVENVKEGASYFHMVGYDVR